jgi:UDP-N-acetylmuramoyl-tripeptide--D-alanyl-D-alanine ligase
MLLSLSEIASALGKHSASLGGELHFTGVCTDTRLIATGDLFVALVSPKDNGHRYIDAAVLGGAAAIVASEDVDPIGVPVIKVADTTVAYGQIARIWRDRFDLPVIGITGSVGKTTTKEMIAATLSPLGPVLKTELSQNNETGVPKALLKLAPDHRAAVVEMGMRGKGQIAELCAIARPVVGVITVISDNHIELLGTKEAIADAKGELVASLSIGDTAVLNADDTFSHRLSKLTSARVVHFGHADSAKYMVTSERREEDGWVFEIDGVEVRTLSPARHDVSNAAAAIAVAVECGVELRAAAEALAKYVPAPMRMELVRVEEWDGLILNDAYNAAPASVKSALETLFTYNRGRRIAFLGDMKELGDRAESAHREVGDAIKALGGLDELYTVGDLAAGIAGATLRFTKSTEAAEFAAKSLELRAGDTILVKGSRSMAMEWVVHALAGRDMAVPRGAG